MENAVLGIGNPLLDISASVDEALLTKYNLKPADAILAEEKHLPLYSELTSMSNVEYLAGGANQNTIRAVQWMLQTPGATNYIGCVGKDKYADDMKKEASADGVSTHYLVTEEAPTGTCAVLIINKERSMVANLGAANLYKVEHLQHADRQKLIEQAKVIYATGYFLTVSVPSLMLLAEHCNNNNKPFLFNLSAPFLIDFFWDEKMESIFPYIDILFGNESEFACLGKRLGLEGKDLKEIGLAAAAREKKNQGRPRVVIVTQGSSPTLICREGKVTEVPVDLIPAEKLIDTNGAGDSFCGGFIAQFLKEGATDVSEKSCLAGHYCAGVTVQTSGTNFRGKTPSFA